MGVNAKCSHAQTAQKSNSKAGFRLKYKVAFQGPKLSFLLAKSRTLSLLEFSNIVSLYATVAKDTG